MVGRERARLGRGRWYLWFDRERYFGVQLRGTEWFRRARVWCEDSLLRLPFLNDAVVLVGLRLDCVLRAHRLELAYRYRRWRWKTGLKWRFFVRFILVVDQLEFYHVEVSPQFQSGLNVVVDRPRWLFFFFSCAAFKASNYYNYLFIYFFFFWMSEFNFRERACSEVVEQVFYSYCKSRGTKRGKHDRSFELKGKGRFLMTKLKPCLKKNGFLLQRQQDNMEVKKVSGRFERYGLSQRQVNEVTLLNNICD